ncbi:PHP domain-containing protein [Candidatus Poribacteria bacterium]
MAFEYDYHVHTTLSYCHEGELTIDNLVKAAQETDLEGFAITDHSAHVYFDRPTVSRHQYLLNYDIFLETLESGNDKFEKYLDMIDMYRTANVLTGTEVDVAANGKLIFDSQHRDRLDVLLGGIHWLPCVDSEFDNRTLRVQFMDYTMMLLETDIDILTHPTRIFRRRKMEVPREVVHPIVRRAKEKGVAIEINGHTQRDPDEYFVRACINEGVKLAMGTDTHSITEIGNFSYQRELLAKLGVSEEEMDTLVFKHN